MTKEEKRLYDIEYRKKKKDELNEKKKQYYRLNKDLIIDKRKKRYDENKDVELARQQEYRKKNSDKIKDRNKKYYEVNKDTISEKKKEYVKKNIDHVKKTRQEYYQNNKEVLRSKANEREKIKLKTDPLFKLMKSIRSTISVSIRKMGYRKNTRTHFILGCTFDEFKAHIESLWESWMTWDNYGIYEKNKYNVGWDFDHIIPVSSAVTEDDVIRLNHYTNIRPLCSKVNRDEKRDTLT